MDQMLVETITAIAIAIGVNAALVAVFVMIFTDD